MPQAKTITCDFDGKDLTENATEITSYRLTVGAEHIPLKAGVSAMHAAPPIDGIHFFCNALCLGKWAVKKAEDDVKALQDAADAAREAAAQE